MAESWSLVVVGQSIDEVEEEDAEIPDEDQDVIQQSDNALGFRIHASHQNHPVFYYHNNEQNPSANRMVDPVLQEVYTQQGGNPIQHQSPPHIMNCLFLDIFGEEEGDS